MSRLFVFISLMLLFSANVDAQTESQSVGKQSQVIFADDEPSFPLVGQYGIKETYLRGTYEHALNNNEASCQYILSWLFYYGERLNRNYHDAFYWGKKAAMQSHPGGAFIVAKCYELGNGVAQNEAKAKEWYEKALSFAEPQAEKGDALAQDVLGNIYCSEFYKDYQLAIKWYRKAADQGFGNSLFSLGRRYYNGEGVEQNYYQAVYWYQKAASKEHVMALAELGHCYYTGQGVSANCQEAVKCWTKAASYNNMYSQRMLGMCYEKGDGVTKNFDVAVNWYKLAARQGEEKAQEILNQHGISWK